MTPENSFDIVRDMSHAMILVDEFSRILTAFTRLIYPASCAVCRQDLEIKEKYLCSICAQTIELIRAPACKTCAKSIPPYLSQGKKCSECRSRKLHIDSGFATLTYNDTAKEIIHQAKFEKKFWLLDFFHPFLKSFSIRNEFRSYDLIVPVPLDGKRLKVRGFNQSLLIAQALAGSKYSRKVKMVLKKSKHTEPQSQLHRSERLGNLAGAFRLSRFVSVLNRSILLVDDIVTSGATLEECARVLKIHGAKRVDFFALARTTNS